MATTDAKAGAKALRRLRLARGWSWAEQAGRLRSLAQSLRFARIGASSVASIQRTIARWEKGEVTPGDQYQTLLGHLYARTPSGAVELGPGSDFAELLAALAQMGVDQARLDELTTTVAATATDTGMSLLAFLGGPLRAELVAALDEPDHLDAEVVEGLAAATGAVNQQIGTVPFARLQLAQAAIVDACRQLLNGRQPPPVRARLQEVAATSYALAARLAFECHDDVAALHLYDEAVAAAGGQAHLARRALIRTSHTMVVHYATGDVARARRIADLAVQDARRSASRLVRARAHAVQAEMAARGGQPHHAHAALHLAWHDLDGDTSDDPQPGAFSTGRLRGFEGVCAIFLGEADAAEQNLAASVATLHAPRDAVQRAIVLTDQALARLKTDAPGAPEAATDLLHWCIDATAATRGRVPAQRIRQARLELRPWRGERFVADLDDHIHTAFIGL